MVSFQYPPYVVCAPYLFRQLQDPDTKTFTYLMACAETKEAVVIDPVLEQTDIILAWVQSLGLRLLFSCETHIHADHRSGSFQLQAHCGCQIVYGAAAQLLSPPHGVYAAKEGNLLTFGRLQLSVLETPGHTNHDVTYAGLGKLFTGDSLLIGGCGRTDFQSGSAHKLWHSVTERLFHFPEEALVYPGHDYNGNYVSCIGQEKKKNPRFLNHTADSFIELMNNLNLPHPQHFEVAIPYNVSCGQITKET